MSSRVVPVRQIGLILMAVIVAVAIVANAASRLIETPYPEWALWLNPLNNDARIQLITTTIESGRDDALLTAEQLASTGTQASPGDARMFSMLGVIKEQQGLEEEAQVLFKRALTLLPTESYALLMRFAYLAEREQFLESVDVASMIFRRWPDTIWPLLDTYWPAILEDGAAFEKTITVFSNTPFGQRGLIEAVDENPENGDLTLALISELVARRSPDMWPYVNMMVSRLVDDEKFGEAYALFVAALDEAQLAQTGPIHNGRFVVPTTRNFFDWKIGNQKGLKTSFTTVARENSEVMDTALEMQFLNSPVKVNTIWQNLNLAAGDYELSADYLSRRLRAPKDIGIVIKCLPGYAPIAELPLLASDTKRVQSTVRFRVANETCPIQRVGLETEFLATTWRNRFQGMMRLFEVSIKPMPTENDGLHTTAGPDNWEVAN